MTPSTRTISTDKAFRILANQQRRRVLHCLIETDGTTTVDRLAQSISTITSSPTDRDATRDQVALELHHVHLPMLQEAGLVEYDPRHETIRYRSSDLVDEVLGACSSK